MTNVFAMVTEAQDRLAEAWASVPSTLRNGSGLLVVVLLVVGLVRKLVSLVLISALAAGIIFWLWNRYGWINPTTN